MLMKIRFSVFHWHWYKWSLLRAIQCVVCCVPYICNITAVLREIVSVLYCVDISSCPYKHLHHHWSPKPVEEKTIMLLAVLTCSRNPLMSSVLHTTHSVLMNFRIIYQHHHTPIIQHVCPYKHNHVFSIFV